MAYVEKGTGPTLLLVHGVLVDYRYWQTQVDALAPTVHVIAVLRMVQCPVRVNG